MATVKVAQHVQWQWGVEDNLKNKNKKTKPLNFFSFHIFIEIIFIGIKVKTEFSVNIFIQLFALICFGYVLAIVVSNFH